MTDCVTTNEPEVELTLTAFNEPGYMAPSGEGCDYEGPYYFVVAYDKVFGDDLTVAKFEWDDTSPDRLHHKAQALELARRFTRFMQRETR